MASILQTGAPSISVSEPLCVKLDGTLISTSLWIEALLALVKSRPICLLFLPWWWLRGSGFFKERVCRLTPLDVTLLPFEPELVAYLREQQRSGRSLALAGAPAALGAKIADHLGLSFEVLDRSVQDRFQSQRFCYVANSTADLPLWKQASSAVLVNGSSRLASAIRRVNVRVAGEFKPRRNRLALWSHALRIHQWSKNGLIFVPLFLSHQSGNPKLLWQAVAAFSAFSLCASGVYIMNDLLDLSADRRHPSKRRRPWASGRLPVHAGLVAIPLLLLASFGLAVFTLPRSFVVVLAIYWLLTAGYSFHLKTLLLIDVVALAGLYTLRIVAGGEATSVRISPWLLCFSIFLFLSLALVKRFAELKDLGHAMGLTVSDRAYLAQDATAIASAGIASGYVSVLVMCLYINSPEIRLLYSRPERLWLVCPIAIYWISRIWILAHRGEVRGDPVVFALREKVSYVVGLSMLLVVYFAV